MKLNIKIYIAIGSNIFISAHIIDHTTEGGRAEVVFQETTTFIYSIRSQYPNESFAVVTGVDANVTLPAGYDDVTGSSVLKPAPSHKTNMQSAVFGMATSFGDASAKYF